jgi:RNase P protein component
MSGTIAWRSLARKGDFQKVYNEGAKSVGRLVVVYLLPAADAARAVVASRKVGGSVQRNRAKRLLREAFRKGTLGRAAEVRGISQRLAAVWPTGNVAGAPAQNLWVVLVARRNILAAGAVEVQAELDTLLRALLETTAPTDGPAPRELERPPERPQERPPEKPLGDKPS